MYKEDEQDDYYLHKFLIALMFDNNCDSYKQMPWIYDLDVLETFKCVISDFAEHSYIRDNIKENIYDILIDGRDIKDKDYKKRIEIINEIIKTLNLQVDDSSIIFYIYQLQLRENKKSLKSFDVESVQEKIPDIEDSIYNDFLVLLSHREETTDEEFLNEYLPNFINNDLYYESLNVILKECPSMFKNELFMSRVNQILNINKKLDRNNIDKSNNIIKVIKKGCK